jgi:hypothetical protein
VNSKPEDGRQVWREHIRSEFEKSKGLSRGDVSAIEHRLRIGSRQYVLLPLTHTRPSMLAPVARYTIPPISASATTSSSLRLVCLLRHTLSRVHGQLARAELQRQARSTMLPHLPTYVVMLRFCEPSHFHSQPLPFSTACFLLWQAQPYPLYSFIPTGSSSHPLQTQAGSAAQRSLSHHQDGQA